MLTNRAAVQGKAPPLDARPIERRRHQRVKVALLGRYMLEDKREFPCQTTDMSPGGVALSAPVKGAIGSRVVVYVDQIGRIEGRVVRHLDQGFALSLNVPLIKREKLADQLTWLANRHILGMPEDRRHERITPRNQRSTLRLEDGREYIVKLIDVSLSGAAVKADVQPPLGTLVTIGRTAGRIVRHFEGGIAVEFMRQMPVETFDENVEI
jgi:hypothetical protein